MCLSSEGASAKTDTKIVLEALSYADAIVFLTEKELQQTKGRSSPVICLMKACNNLARKLAQNHEVAVKLSQEARHLANQTDNALLMVETQQQQKLEWLSDVHQQYTLIREDIQNIASRLNSHSGTS